MFAFLIPAEMFRKTPGYAPTKSFVLTARLAVTENPADYLPGDLVTWALGGNVPHIGIVVDEKSAEGVRHLIVHNIGQGPRREDVLFAWKITGHYRYYGPNL